MIRKVIGYVFLIIIMFCISIFCENYEMFFSTVFIVLLPIINFMLIKLSTKNITVGIDIKNIMIRKDESIIIETSINNKGILPVVMIEFEFICENKLHKKDRVINLSLPILRWGKQKCVFSIKSVYCGDIKIKLNSLKCLDYFGITAQKINKNFSKDVYILPNVTEIKAIEINNALSGDVEGLEFSKIKSGDDPSEVFDIRTYRPGDKLHSVHWKLSSRKKEIMVKEFSYPVNSNYSIIMDLSVENKNMSKYIDAVVEVVLDIILKVQEQGINQQLIAFERNGKYTYKDIIDAEATVLDIMYEMYKSSIKIKHNLLEAYEMKNEANDETNVYYVSSYFDINTIRAFDKVFSHAKKNYIYICESKKDNMIQMDNDIEVEVMPVVFDALESGLQNICI